MAIDGKSPHPRLPVAINHAAGADLTAGKHISLKKGGGLLMASRTGSQRYQLKKPPLHGTVALVASVSCYQ